MSFKIRVIKTKQAAEEISTHQIFTDGNLLSSSFISAVDHFNFIHAKINTAKRPNLSPTHHHHRHYNY